MRLTDAIKKLEDTQNVEESEEMTGFMINKAIIREAWARYRPV
jgi:hypothetical protein